MRAEQGPNFQLTAALCCVKKPCFVLLMEIQKLTRAQNEILEQLRLLAMGNTVVTQNMDALEPVNTMQEFDIEEDNLKGQLDRKKKVKFFLFCF